MKKRFGQLKASTCVSLSTGVIFLLAAMTLVFIINRQQQKETLDAAREKAFLLLDQNLATHFYFSQELKPKLFELIDPLGMEGYFEPSWMASTYAVRQIETYSESLRNESYYYKECAINARWPGNEADEFERAFIERLNKEPELEKWSGKRRLDGKDYFVLLRRGETMEESCLRCHSTPEMAPADLVARYGPERSFNRNVGDVPSAISIRIPISQAYAAATRYSFGLIVLVLCVLTGIFVVHQLLNKYFLVGPLNMVREKACDIASNTERLGEKIPSPKGKELQELVDSFNEMSVSLRSSHDNLERQVKERTAELEQANKEMERFTYTVAHDLKSPMATVKGFLDELKNDILVENGKEVESDIAFMDSALAKMSRFVDSSLELCISGREISEPREVSMGDVVSDAVEQLSGVIKENDVELRVCGEFPVVMGDMIRLTQVVQNLIDNAIKYSAGQANPVIEVGCEQTDGEPVFYVRDNGSGIGPAKHEEIFGSFNQVNCKSDGYGIGLATAKRIIEVHNGRIWAESAGEGQGCTFYFAVGQSVGLSAQETT